MAAKRKPVSDQLRDEILNAEISRYRLAKETGLSEAALSRFVNGVCNLSLGSINKVSEVLGLEITKQKPKKRKGK